MFDAPDHKLKCRICDFQAYALEEFQARAVVHREGPAQVRFPKHAGGHGRHDRDRRPRPCPRDGVARREGPPAVWQEACAQCR